MTRSRFITLDEANLKGKRVLLRVDFNVPIKDGKVADDSRIKATLTTIRYLQSAGAGVAILSHLGSPRAAIYDSDYSLAPVAKYLSQALDQDVPLIVEWLEDLQVSPGQIVMLENIRFASGEKTNTDALARKMATLCDVYVNEAFASARREQSSVHGIAKYLPLAYTGPLFVKEVEALDKAVNNIDRPLVFVIGGQRRPEIKFELLKTRFEDVDKILVGGVIGNTFLKAANREMGKSLYLPEFLDLSRELLAQAKTQNKAIIMPVDIIVGTSMDDESDAVIKKVDALEPDELILDIGPETVALFQAEITPARTVFWTGPLGLVELDKFQSGTYEVARSIARSDGYSIANGGDTLSVIETLELSTAYSHLSTGGGSSLEFLQGKQLPAVSMMEESARVRYAVEREY
ncbi:MAG: phosphoglycerate kinase [Gammaproteobacteria bacterium]|nr:phosphoglycerate kinase [Gammaproteobacteria bacterium]